ncbi:serine/threonine-protein phosphatase 4 regulatory subunit 2 [Anopheles funestus]|uniref:serine/threonine-protein phosphatase 4 regulatory subunit 2 n=1 Tax=Anopheles funestus TaxID=62324 RepID=UPI0020C734C0|nr:serine/threonine-protein phosphatase 4 regulatory subunit 2 [Anopheles funestus]
MTMENQEEILMLLERFTKSKQKDIPRELEDYLNFVARTGDTLYRWVLVKPLFREKLVNVITDFHHSTPSIADIPQCPNVDPFNFERMKRALLERMDSFNSAPFTVQRICELLTEPRKQYTRIDKFMRAVEKNILVVSTQEPGRRRSDSENGDSLDSIVNGDLEVNVDIEMDNEQFHLEADALLPDSSDPVSSLHGSLADVGASQRACEGNEINGGRVVGAFMNNDAGNQTAKGGLNSDGHQSVIDTNENATDGDIAAPLLEASLESSSSVADAAVQSGKDDELEKESLHEPTSINEEDAINTDAPAQTAREEETGTTARDTLVPADKPSADSAVHEAVAKQHEEKEENIDVIKSQANSAGGEDEKDTIVQEDEEPKAKMVKYDDDPLPAQSISCTTTTTTTTSVIKAEVHASDVSDALSTQPESEQAVEEKTTEPNPSKLADTLDETVKENTTIESGSVVLGEQTVIASDGGNGEEADSVTLNASSATGDVDRKEHSKSDQEAESVAPTITTVVSEPSVTIPQEADSTEQTATNAAEMEASCAEPTIQVAGEDDRTTAQQLEMELAAVAAAASAATPSEIVVEEVDMTGEPGATEMAEEDTKADDNVMDIDESSVEMMDQ